MDVIEQTARFARALSDRTRVRIVVALGVRNLCVCELTSLLGAGQPLVSRHLAILRAAGLVEDVRAGRWVEYRLARLPDGSLGADVLERLAELAADEPSLRAFATRARGVDRRGLQQVAAAPSPASRTTGVDRRRRRRSSECRS